MDRGIWKRLMLPRAAGLLLIFMLNFSYAEQPDWPDSLKKTKKPNEFVEWGWDLRIRDERFLFRMHSTGSRTKEIPSASGSVSEAGSSPTSS